MLARAVIAVISLTALASCATREAANDTPGKLAAVGAYLASDFSCGKKDAVAVDLAALQRDPAAYADKCVRFQAFSDGRNLSRTANEVKLSTDVRVAGGHPADHDGLTLRPASGTT